MCAQREHTERRAETKSNQCTSGAIAQRCYALTSLTVNASKVSTRSAAAQIAREIGPSAMRALHRSHPALDALEFVLPWLSVVLLGVALTRVQHIGLWSLLCLLQGCALQCVGYVAHDVFVHRRRGGRRVAKILANLCWIPILVGATEYESRHLAHHRHPGPMDDGEDYKRDMDRRWVRALFLCAPFTLMIMARRFRRADAVDSSWKPSEREARVVRFEKLALALFVALVAASAWLWPRATLLGYVVPLLVAGPIASATRIVLEHGESDPSNPFHAATCYRTGWITQLLFLSSVGDMHLIHHLFPGIPAYRLRAARRLVLPILQREGVPVRESLARILWGWFVDNRPHYSLWNDARASAPERS